MHKYVRVAGALLAAAFVHSANAEAGISCIITPGTPTTYASLDYGDAMSSFDSSYMSAAMCLPSAFSVFDSRFVTADFSSFAKFRSDAPEGFAILLQ